MPCRPRTFFVIAFLTVGPIGCSQAPPPKTAATSQPTATNSALQSDITVADTAEPEDAAAPAAPMKELSREELVQEITQKQRQAMTRLQRRKFEDVYRFLQQSGKQAEELLRRFPDLTPREQQICSRVFYNQTCALSQQGDVVGAMAAMQRAFDCGWNDVEQLDQDEDLEPMRSHPDFAAARDRWVQAAKEKMETEVAIELANFESYPFDFTLPDLDDMPVKLADFQKNVVVVDIWGTWCPPCRAEIPSFVKLQAKYKEQGLQIIGVNYEQAEDETAKELIRDFRDQHNMNYPCLIGDETTRQQVPKFRGFPTTLFLDRHGKVRLEYVGAHPQSRLEAVIVALLAESET